MYPLLFFFLIYKYPFLFFIGHELKNFYRHGFKEATQFEKINKKYGGLDTILVGIERKNIISKEGLKELYKLQKDLKKIDEIGFINSFVPNRILEGMKFVEITPSNIDTLYSKIIDFIKENNESMYRKDAGMIFVQLKKDASSFKAIKEIINTTKKYKDMKFHYFGNRVMEYFLNKYIIIIISLIISVVILLLLLVFRFSLGDKESVILSIAPSGMAALWVFAYIFALGNSLNLLTILTPLFVIVIGSAGGLHFISHYMENKDKIKDKEKAIIETMKMIGIPMIMTAVTTMAGFLSLEVSSISEVRKMGFFTAVGIGFATLISWFFVPSVLKMIELKGSHKRPLLLKNSVKFFLNAYKRPKLVLTYSLVIVVIFALFIPFLKIYADETLFFKNYTKVVRDANFFKEKFGFSSIDIIDYKTGTKDAIQDKKIREKIKSFEKELRSVKGVKDVVSYFDIVEKIEKHINNKMIANIVLPIMIKQDILPIDLWVYKNRDFKILVQVESGDSNTILAIKRVCDKYKTATLTGPDYLFYVLNSKVIHDQLYSLLLAISLVLILLFAFYRRIEYALKGIVPIVVTLVIFFGFLKLSGFNLNIVIATLASISIGIGIDYAIHFIGAYIYYKKDIEKVINSVSVPVLTNAFGLSIGLSGLLLSPLRVHLYVSISMWVTMVVSSFSAMLLLPVLFKGKD